MSEARPNGAVLRARTTAALLLAACAPALAAGCGGSSGQAGGSAAGASTQHARDVRPVPAQQGSSAPQSRSAPRDRSAASGPQAAVRPTGAQRARRQRGMIDDEVSASGAKQPNPCALVDRGEAQRIMGAAVQRPVLAPQGPTCIYRMRDSKRQVTIALQSSPPAGRPEQDRLTHRMRVRVAGTHAYCGIAGQPTLILPLRGRRFIAVAAVPCPLAAAFAARALAHLGAL